MLFLFFTLRRPPRSTRTYTLVRTTTRCRSPGRAEPRTAAAVHRQQRLLARRDPGTRALLQDGQSRLPGMGAQARLRRFHRADRAAAVLRAAAEIPARRAGARGVPAAGGASRAGELGREAGGGEVGHARE